MFRVNPAKNLLTSQTPPHVISTTVRFGTDGYTPKIVSTVADKERKQKEEIITYRNLFSYYKKTSTWKAQGHWFEHPFTGTKKLNQSQQEKENEGSNTYKARRPPSINP